jgi:succinate-semialdehyde dehydrogenase/glutarate-semialdehyde dehydrogenase
MVQHLNKRTMKLTSINPVNGEKIKEYDTLNEEQVSEKIEQTHEAWLSWRKTGPDD